MLDKNRNELEIGDMVKARIFDMQRGAENKYGFVVEFRGHEHVEVKVRNDRKQHYIFLGVMLEKVPKEEALLYLLNDTVNG